MILRRLPAAAVACALVLLACSPAPDAAPPSAPAPAPIATTDPAPTMSASPAPTPPPPVASADPLDSTKVPAWTDPAAVRALAIDCKVAVQPVGGGGDPNPLSCGGEVFEQSCAPDLCFDATSACRHDCRTTCQSCDDACVTSCSACKAPCTDDACRAACGASCGACRQACLTTRDTCTTGACGERDQKCQKDVVAKAKECGYTTHCAKLQACIDPIYKHCQKSKDPDCYDKARDACYKLIAPCPAEYAGICSFAGPKYFAPGH